ncbi:MAG: bifunctional methylenetetrahydrofolate dehydrogenase/methenyltetrahydrofolate cyclohydrolase [Candidatus Magasanikbacteria bacterium]|nr:bifunctional methylenetetrahydrofolate dehydrogenase/methenyltetrahydrofolate cyclohydrolase [Candidatus Magasanikbacteria bacterium]
MITIDGRQIANALRAELKEKIKQLPSSPGLGVILVGNDPASHLYVTLKEAASKEIGVRFVKKIFPETISQAELLRTIREMNADNSIHAILIQLPLPHGFDEDEAIAIIDPVKDVDGFHPQNISALLNGHHDFIKPVLAQSIWALVNEGLVLQNRMSVHETLHALLIGNNTVFTIPVATYLKSKGIKTDAVLASALSKPLLKQYDIIIVACGRPGIIGSADVARDAVIIDIGTNKLSDGRVVGDTDFASFANTECAITPVPGGIGPVTVAMLMKNTVELARRAMKI